MEGFWTLETKIFIGVSLVILAVFFFLLRVKLYKLLIKSFIGPFIGTFFISVFLLLMQTIWKYLEDLVGKGLELSVIFEFIFYFAIHLIPMALPLAILLSSIMVFGNLAERYELVAIKSAGVSLLRAMRPMFAISITLAIVAFYTANSLIPKANLSWGALLYDVTKKKPAMNIVDNVFFKDIDGYQIRVGKKHEDNQTIEDIIIYVDDSKISGNNNILIAKKGKMVISEEKQFMTLHLEDGKRYQELVDDPGYKKTMPHNTMEFATYDLNIDLGELAFNRTEKSRFSEDQRMMNVKQLGQRIDSLGLYIERKSNSLYRYLEPYFYEASDTLVLSDTGISDRLDYLLAYKVKPIVDGDQTVCDDGSDGVVLPSGKILGRTKKKRRVKKVNTEVRTNNEVIEKALQNVNNIKRISINNIDDTSVQHDMMVKYQIEWHRKYTIAISCILLFFIGAPLGAIIKKGGFGLPLVIAILLFIGYYILGIFGEKLVKQNAISPLVGMWFSSMVLFPLALFLTYKASRDSQLFDMSAYKDIVKSIRRRLTKQGN